MRIYKDRRDTLINLIKASGTDGGVILLFAGFEQARYNFVQDSTFYYYTGISEPGVVLAFDFNNNSTLFIPDFLVKRTDWVVSELDYSKYFIDKIEYLGQPLDGYSLQPFFKKENYANLINFLDSQAKVFTPCPNYSKYYSQQLYLLQRLGIFCSNLNPKLQDISLQISRMRQVKDAQEVALIERAINITLQAQDAIFNTINCLSADLNEADIHAIIDHVYASNFASQAFPSIVATGINSTVLHYTQNSSKLCKEQTLVVDIGAMQNNYCADITRTYSTSGSFTKEQQIIYDLVQDTQNYIAGIAKPGYWLNNKNNQDLSLHHLAVNYLKERGGYDKYFLHGLGHYLGLDVHDAGDYSLPLRPGEVFTIEPGIYMRDKEIGVRIEDDYLVTQDGVRCLSK